MEEIITIVDEHNHVIGSDSRKRARAENLIHRASYIFVFNTKMEIFVHKRVKTKDVYPGYYDVCAGGVLLNGESYETGAVRELAEEFGINDVPLTTHFDFFYNDKMVRVWGRVFSCVYDGEFVLQKEEIESGVFMSEDAIFSFALSQQFTPDGLHALKRLQNED